MNSPPASVVVKLEDRDVREDLTKIVNAMSRIRAETVTDRVVTDGKKDEYLHLTFRLASGMKATADKTMREKMGIVAEAVDRNEALLNYDPMQDGYWNRRDSRFSQALDDLLISVARDDFHTLDDKHHILQAVKFLGAESAEFEERERVLGTILPYNGALPVNLIKEKRLRRVLSRIFGSRYRADRIDDLTLRLEGDLDNLDAAIETARGMGYTSVLVPVPSKERGAFIDRYRGAFICDHELGDIASEEGKSLSGKVIGALIKYTSPISYPIMGGLPIKIRRKINDIARSGGYNFNEKTQFKANILPELSLGVVASIAGVGGLGRETWVPGVYLLIHSIGKFLASTDYQSDDITIKTPRGSLHYKLPLLPLELLMSDDKNKGEVFIKIPTNGQKTVQAAVPNPTEFYENIASLDVPLEIEQNLVYGLGNHHSFGNRFIKYVNEKTPRTPDGLQITADIYREYQALVYCSSLPVEQYKYRRDSLLYLSKGQRYLVTTVAQQPQESITRRIARILAEDSDVSKKAEAIEKEVGAKYVHLKRFEEGRLTHDYEVTN